MKNYVKPVVLENEGLAEGVYAASGVGDCYTATATITQTPQEGRDFYVIQVSATHNAADGHHSTGQVLTLSFNQPVTYVGAYGSGASLVSGDGTSELQISYSYHANGNENLGGDSVEVQSAPGLAVLGATLSCNHTCADHDGLGNY